MATLQELESKFKKVESKVESLRTATEKTRNALQALNDKIQGLTDDIKNLEETEIPTLDGLVKSTKDATRKAEYEKNLAQAKAELNRKRKELADANKAMPEKTQAEKDLEDAEKEMNTILMEFAAEPTINAYLQEQIEYNVRRNSAGYDKAIERVTNLRDAFAKAMLDKNGLGDKVENFVVLTKAYEAFDPYNSDKDIVEKRALANSARLNAVDELRDEITNNPALKGITLTRADFEALLAYTDTSVTFELPSLNAEIQAQENNKAVLTARKDKIIDLIKNARVITTGPKTPEEEAIERSIADKKKEADAAAKNAVNEEAMVNANDTKLKRRAELEKRIAELEDTNPAEKQSNEVIAAKSKLDDAERELVMQRRSNGQPITKLDLITIYGEEGNQKYTELFAADLAVRKAVMNVKTTSDPKAKDELVNAINAYRGILQYFTDKGYTGAELHNAILTDLNEKIKNKETIDEAYNTDLIPSRVDKIGSDLDNTFKIGDDEYKTEDVLRAIKMSSSGIDKEVDTILESDDVKPYDITGTDLAIKISDYHSRLATLFAGIKDIQKLSSIDELYAKLKGSIAKKVNRFKNFLRKIPLIGKMISSEPEQKAFKVQSENEKTDAEKAAEQKVNDAKKAYEEALKKDKEAKARNIGTPIKKELSDAEKEELENAKAELQALPTANDLNRELTSISKTLADTQKKISDLQAEIANLEKTRQELANKRTTSAKTPIEHPEDVNHKAADNLVKKTVEKFDNEVRKSEGEVR